MSQLDRIEQKLDALIDALGFDTDIKITTKLTGEKISGMRFSSKEFKQAYPDKILADHNTPDYEHDGNFHIVTEHMSLKLVKKQ
jgi:hypothetical protein